MTYVSDPFAPVDLTIEFVDSVAGSQKTRGAIKNALLAARRRGERMIFAMPTLDLVSEMTAYARSLDDMVPVYEITSRNRPLKGSIDWLICKHIASHRAQAGHLLFITHEGFQRVTSWPPETAGFDIYIDEVLDVILSRKPFKLRDSHWVLTSFLETVPVPTTIPERNKRKQAPAEFTYPKPGSIKKTDWDRLETCIMILQAESNASDAEVEMALKEGKRLKAKQDRWEAWVNQTILADDRVIAMSYYQVIPKLTPTQDPLYGLKRREYGKRQDDIYEYLEPVPKWLVQGNALFTDMAAWNKATIKSNNPQIKNDFKRGLITITGFLRPDALRAFNRVTVMSALFKHTMLYAVWQTLGVEFIPSQTLDLSEMTTDLGKRKLKIYWLSDEGWSKRSRDLSGGIEKILQLIKDSNVIDAKQKVCVVINKDDGSEKQSGTVTAVFNNGMVMPNNVRGQNRWRDHHQLIHCAALNSYTSDIRWMESVLGIDSHAQRIGRTGQEVYQALMRLSLREPTATDDITLVVMDKDVAEWLVQWFSPSDQVEVSQIDASGVIRRKGKTGRPLIGDTTLTKTERQRRWRAKRALSGV